jgi:hypothetical protein
MSNILSKLDIASDFIKPEISKKAKRLALRLDTKSRLIRFVIPHRASLRKAQSFLDLHHDWIIDKIDELPEPVHFNHDTILPLFDVDHKIHVVLDKNRKRTSISLKDNVITVKTNKADPGSRIDRFLRNLALKRITEMCHEKAAIIQKPISSINVRDTKTRWGSCSASGGLSFSWRLIFAPYETLDYIVAHEVAHLVHLNHSKEFWALCRELSESYTKGKHWIKLHGHSLMRYGYAPYNPEQTAK